LHSDQAPTIAQMPGQRSTYRGRAIDEIAIRESRIAVDEGRC
jgi:hypothetical protein